MGRVRPGTETRLDCEQPLRAVCRHCDHVEYWRCDSYGCATCGELKRRRLVRLIEAGTGQHLGTGLFAYFLTLTAPGEVEHSRWFQGKRPQAREACTCHQHGLTLGMWNRQESACWNRLRTAMTRDASVVFCGAVETQKRGALHRHLVLFSDVELDHRGVQEKALAAGYGCVLDLQELSSPGQVARYLAKYVTKAAGDRQVVPWESLDPETGEVTGKRATYRLWSSSRSWGVTMRQIKAVMGAQAAARAKYLRELQSALADEASAAAAGLAPVASLSPSPG